MARNIQPIFGPRIEHPDQTDMIPLLDDTLPAQQADDEAGDAQYAIGENGPPGEPDAPEQCIEPVPPVEPEALDPVAPLPELEPSYANLHAIYSSVFGPRWHVHAREWLGVNDERVIRRWRDGEGAPGEVEMGKARDQMLDIAIEALRAIGETDLASPLVALKAGRRKAADRRAIEIHARNVAFADAKKAVVAAKEEARLARHDAWWKAECAKGAKIAAETLANPRFFVSLAKPPKAAPEAVSLAKPPRVAENA